MKLRLVELTDKNTIYGIYDIYKTCMFMPTKENFLKKTETFLADENIKIFACIDSNTIKGVCVISFKNKKTEIIGIAVDKKYRRQGIGSYMINKIQDNNNFNYLYAETDNDSVGFYRKNRFKTTEFSKDYNGETIKRYRCELKRG